MSVGIVAASSPAVQISGRNGEPPSAVQMLDFRKFLTALKNCDFAVKPVDVYGIVTFFLGFQRTDLWQGIIMDMMDFIVCAMCIANPQQIELTLGLDAAAAVDGNDVFVTVENRIKLLNTVII